MSMFPGDSAMAVLLLFPNAKVGGVAAPELGNALRASTDATPNTFVVDEPVGEASGGFPNAGSALA